MTFLQISNYALWCSMIFLYYLHFKKGKSSSETINYNQGTISESDHGIDRGRDFPIMEFISNEGNKTKVSGEGESLVIITSASCLPCNSVYRSLPKFTKKHPDTRVVLFMIGLIEQINQKIIEENIQLPVCPVHPKDLDILETRIFPFGYRLNGAGKVVCKGLVNTDLEMVNILNCKGI
ncbi:hypothetical protein [Fontibacillus sp. BL9]|uniref:hypothetical protein n=1 Tax=Fontibacillus sp. BL9 TaxID=3389971 RepID=UPI00397A4F10